MTPEDRVRVRLAVDVGDAPVVADDRDVLGLLLPARNIALTEQTEKMRVPESRAGRVFSWCCPTNLLSYREAVEDLSRRHTALCSKLLLR